MCPCSSPCFRKWRRVSAAGLAPKIVEPNDARVDAALSNAAARDDVRIDIEEYAVAWFDEHDELAGS
jgi:hypothetical protein